MTSSKPVIFLLVLLSVVLFLVGFRLGKSVERVDQTYKPSPTPTAPVSPTPTPLPLSFSTFINPDCDLTFLYPTYLEENQVSSGEAKLQKKDETISVSCIETTVIKKRDEFSNLKEDDRRRVKDQRVAIYEEDGKNVFFIYNTLNGKWVFFETSPNLTNLILATVDFVR